MARHNLSRSDLEALFPEPILTPSTVAERLGLNVVTITRAIRRGELESLGGLRRQYRLTRSAVTSWALGEGGDDGDNPVPSSPTPEPSAPAAADTLEPRISEAALARRRSMTPKRKAA